MAAILSFSNFCQKWKKHKFASVSLTVRDRAISSKFCTHRISQQSTLANFVQVLEQNSCIPLGGHYACQCVLFLVSIILTIMCIFVTKNTSVCKMEPLDRVLCLLMLGSRFRWVHGRRWQTSVHGVTTSPCYCCTPVQWLYLCPHILPYRRPSWSPDTASTMTRVSQFFI